MREVKVKKPFWKKWWFWGLAVVLLIVIASLGSDNTGNPTVSSNKSAPEVSDKAIKAGEYKVGVDIEAGEYVLVSNGGGYFQLATNSSGSLNSIVANDLFDNRTIVTISDEQYFQLKNSKAYPIADAPTVNTDNGTLKSGMYKVGIDLPAGEYKVESQGDGYIEVSNNSLHSINSIATNDIFDGSKYITVSDGQYVKLSNVTLYLNN